MARENEVQGRVQQKQAARRKRSADMAAEVAGLQHSYARIKDEPAFQDLLAKAKSFAAYHTKMAKDGVGYRDTGEFKENGQPVQEVVYYDQAKRLSELDKASGIEELEGYILRQLTPTAVAAVEAAIDDTDTEDEEAEEAPAPAPVA